MAPRKRKCMRCGKPALGIVCEDCAPNFPLAWARGRARQCTNNIKIQDKIVAMLERSVGEAIGTSAAVLSNEYGYTRAGRIVLEELTWRFPDETPEQRRKHIRRECGFPRP